jgi:hypothetical protein
VKNIKMSEKIAVERSNFITLYKELQERQEKENKMPDELKSLKTKQDLLIAEKKKKEKQLLLEERKKQVIKKALIEANEEIKDIKIDEETKIKYLKDFKEKLKVGIK